MWCVVWPHGWRSELTSNSCVGCCRFCVAITDEWKMQFAVRAKYNSCMNGRPNLTICLAPHSRHFDVAVVVDGIVGLCHPFLLLFRIRYTRTVYIIIIIFAGCFQGFNFMLGARVSCHENLVAAILVFLLPRNPCAYTAHIRLNSDERRKTFLNGGWQPSCYRERCCVTSFFHAGMASKIKAMR